MIERNRLGTVVALVITAGLMGCTNGEDVTHSEASPRQRVSFTADQSCMAELYTLDYSANLGLVIEESEALRGPGSPPAFSVENLVVDPADPSLTAGEKAAISGLFFNSRRPGESSDAPARHVTTMSASTLAYFAEDFYRSEGRIPSSGAELLLFLHPELNTPTGIDSFKKLAWREQLLKLDYSINPITGRVYTSFTEPVWSPGGVYIRRASEAEVDSDKPILGSILDSIAGERAESRVVTYFGEQPGRVLAREMRTRIEKDSGYFQHPGVKLPGNTPLPDDPNAPSDATNPCHTNPCKTDNPCNPCGH